MSDDLYDSLEDECNDNGNSNNSLDLLQAKVVSVKRVSKLESINGLDSFCSEKRASKDTDFSRSNKAVAVNASHRNYFLPTINNKNSVPGLQELFNHSADYESLAKKGLLLNRDGSFTKSVSDTEELPFITREYKNLVFQKRKTYNSKKPNSVAEGLHKKPCNEKETSNGDFSKLLSNKQWVKVLPKKNSFDESNINFEKNSTMNLTDSMKRELLENNQKSRQRSLEKTNAGQNAKACLSETRTLKDRFLESKTKDLQNFSKQMPKFARNNHKQRLTYLERHQLRNGYNPLFLRPGIKKITSDTTRSNFGDSVTGKLSDVSSRVLSVENLTDSEDEEKFYKEIIEKEKNGTMKARHSSSATGTYSGERGSVIGSGSIRDLEKLRGNDGSSYKQILKPLSIDIKHDGERATKKCSHYCTKDPSLKMSKTELALKGKTYGYMANARNIFKFKSRAEEKTSGRKDLNPKFNELSFVNRQASEMTLNSIKKSLPSLNLAKKVRSGLERSSGRRVKEVGTRNAEDYAIKKGEKSFRLPRVSSSEHKGCKVKEYNEDDFVSVLPWLSN